MENSTLTPVSITQKVIALHTTRKEVCQKWLSENVEKEFAQKLEKVVKQSDQFTDQLMNELSNYGDSISSQVNRDEKYENMAKAMEESLNTDNTSERQADFEKLEERLANIYSDILRNKNDLPESLNKILERQLPEIQNL